MRRHLPRQTDSAAGNQDDKQASARARPLPLITTLAGVCTFAVALQSFVVVLRGPAKEGRTIDERWYKLDAQVMRRSGISTEAQLRAAEFGSKAKSNFSVERLHEAFVESRRDHETDAFLRECAMATESWAGRVELYFKRQMATLLQVILGWSRTDASSFVRQATMLPVTREQLRRTIGRGVKGSGIKEMLDVGAGRGSVSAAVAETLGIPPHNVTAIETCAPLRRGLAARGFRVKASIGDLPASQTFNTVVLLHILDRCNEPMAGGIDLVAWTRLPYLSSTGRETHYALHSALFVLRRT
jgi:hypothetical protein